MQRIGRAGRVQNGEYFSIISRERKEKLALAHKPEISRVDLQSTIIALKAIGKQDVFKFLSLAPEAPSRQNIETALDDLTELGALHRDTGHLTALGKVLSCIPVEPWVGKIIIHGILFKCLDPMITLAAAFTSSKSLFSDQSIDGKDEKSHARRFIISKFAQNSDSDHIAIINAFKDYTENSVYQY